MDLKLVPRSNKDYKYFLCIKGEVTNYLIMVPMHQSRSEVIDDALIENVISKYCVLDYVIMNKDSTFMSLLMNYLFKKLDIKIKAVVPYNHQSLQAEHGIKSLSTILTRKLINLGQIYPHYNALATFVYNTFNTPNLANYSPVVLFSFGISSNITGTNSKLLKT